MRDEQKLGGRRGAGGAGVKREEGGAGGSRQAEGREGRQMRGAGGAGGERMRGVGKTVEGYLWDSLNLLTCAYSSTKTIKSRRRKKNKKKIKKKSDVTCNVSNVACRVSPVTCRVSPVTCHYRQQPEPWMVRKDQQTYFFPRGNFRQLISFPNFSLLKLLVIDHSDLG